MVTIVGASKQESKRWNGRSMRGKFLTGGLDIIIGLAARVNNGIKMHDSPGFGKGMDNNK